MTFAELVVEVAVDLSPETHRDVRREQWLADIRDAAECDLSPLLLALGALTTAVFHRTANRGLSGNALPTSVVGTPRSTLGTVPVLLIGVVLSILFSAVFTLAFGGRHGGGSWQWYRFIAIQATFTTVLPALGIVLIMRALRVPRTRVLLAGASLLIASVVFGGWEVWPDLGFGQIDYSYSLVPTFWGLPVLGLAAWAWATGIRGWRWAYVAGPALLWAAVLPLAPVLRVALLPAFERLPLLAGVAFGTLMLLRSTPRRPGTAGPAEPTERPAQR